MKHFNWLCIFHYLLAGFYSLYIFIFLRLIILIVQIIFTEGWESFYLQSKNYQTSLCQSSTTDSFLSTETGCNIFFISVIGFSVMIFGLLFVSNLMAGLAYQRKKINIFAWIAATLNLIFIFPITTPLGIYSLIVLNNYSKDP